MFQKVVQVTRQRHKDVTLAPVTNYKFANALHSVPLAPDEFPGACIHLPIVFIQEQDKIFPNLMLGLTPGKNLCIDEKNSWIAGYIPWAVKRYPFSFVATDDKEKLALCIDEKCGLFSQRTGETLFDQSGKQSQILDRALDLLQRYQTGIAKAEQFCAKLGEFNLLTPLKIQVQRSDQKSLMLTGLFHINEQRLRELPDDKYLELRRMNYIQFIYFHLVSLQNLTNLQNRNRFYDKTQLTDNANLIPDSFNFSVDRG